VAGPLRALGQPDPPRGRAEVTTVRLDGGAELEVDRLVAREQRQIPVGGRAGDDLDMTLALEIAERAGQVAADPAVQLPHPLVEFFPEVSELDDLVVAVAREVLAALFARALDVFAIERELLLELA